MNSINLVGRLSDDPVLRKTQSGKSVASFSIAVNKLPEGADFFNCIVWGVQADNLVKYQTKGSQIGLTGRLSKRNYDDKDGKKVYVIEVVAEHIEYLGSKKETTETQDGGQAVEEKEELQEDPFTGFTSDEEELATTGSVTLSDDDLPF